MSLRQALAFPFQNGNLLKILPIAIVYSLLLYTMSFTENLFLICGASFAILVVSVAVVGYYISIIEQVMQGEERLPNLRVKTDVGRGCMSYIASILYSIPVLVVFFVMLLFTIPILGAVGDANLGSGLLLMILFVGGFALSIFIMLFTTLVTLVGYARYAAEGTTQALFEFGENIGLVRRNGGLSMGLLGRMFLLALLNGVIALSISGVISVLYPSMNSTFTTFYEPPTAIEGLIFAFLQIGSYTISMIFTVSMGHLVAQYALALGLNGRKRKQDTADNSGTTIALVLFFLVALVFLVAILIVVVLTIMGPVVGDVFSDIATGLGATPTYR